MSKIETRIISVDPKADVTLLEKNARYMTAGQYERLLNNVMRDGCLTSLPLVYREEDGRLIVLSGNHRTMASRDAGLERIEVMEIVTRLSDEQKVAIQLSHNSITGQDEINTLQELYASLGLEGRDYSGLDDSVLKSDPLELPALGSLVPAYQEVHIMFLPEDKQLWQDLLERIKKAPKPAYHFASADAWDAFFNAIVGTKNDLNIVNSATALRTMAQLALERLGQIEAEMAQETGGETEDAEPVNAGAAVA